MKVVNFYQIFFELSSYLCSKDVHENPFTHSSYLCNVLYKGRCFEESNPPFAINTLHPRKA